MPRRARLVLPNHPHHIVHRGHNRRPVFDSDGDRQYYLKKLLEEKEKLFFRMYAFCLMPNHVHLLIDPGNDPLTLGNLMKSVAGQHTQYVNRRSGNKGTLWEGRYYSSPIDVDTYLLACNKYIEMNPVRAGIAVKPEGFRWSSYRHKAGIEYMSWIDEDPAYRSLGTNTEQRRNRYRKSIQRNLSGRLQSFIRTAAKRGQPTGGNAFSEKVFQQTGLTIKYRALGRPKKGSVPFLISSADTVRGGEGVGEVERR